LDKSEVSASALLAVAVTLLTMGADFMKSAQYPQGAVCLICGVALIYATIILVERGVVSRVLKKLRKS
jgi:hypothetical protein